MTIERLPFGDRERYSRPEVMVHDTEVMNNEARFVLVLLEKWGMIQGTDDGEDSAGRAKIRMMTVDETVDRAIDMSQAAFTAMRARGWIVEDMTWAQVLKAVDEEKKLAQAKRLAELEGR